MIKLWVIKTYGDQSSAKINHSFITLRTDFFEMIQALFISLSAKHFLSFLRSTFQTLPNPPLPTATLKMKCVLLIPVLEQSYLRLIPSPYLP